MTTSSESILRHLIGSRLYSMEFVVNDYVQLRFDGGPLDDTATLNCYVWPLINDGAHTWCEQEVGYADAVRRLAPGTVTGASESPESGLRIDLDLGAIIIQPSPDEAGVEIAMLILPDKQWDVWRPGEGVFADLG